MDLSASCLHLTHLTHARIEQWIGGAPLPETALAALLAGFAASFTMVATDGQRLHAQALPALFEKLRGARPGLTIQIDEVMVHRAAASAVLLSYRERHRWDAHATTRRATALFTLNADGQPQWTHLHETWA